MATPSVEFVSSPNEGLRGSGGADRADIVIWDDFWPAPESLREDALRRPFKFFHSQGGFAFNSAEADPGQVQQALKLIVSVVPSELTGAKWESRFVFETSDNEQLTRQKIWVHYDEWIRIGLLYLCPPTGVGGTDFFRHRATGHTSILTVPVGERDLVLADATRPEAWEVVEHVEIRFNRMVLFRPHFFHQATRYFGSSVQDSRLNFVLTFHRAVELGDAAKS
jgi:hypothetical protein